MAKVTISKRGTGPKISTFPIGSYFTIAFSGQEAPTMFIKGTGGIGVNLQDGRVWSRIELDSYDAELVNTGIINIEI